MNTPRVFRVYTGPTLVAQVAQRLRYALAAHQVDPNAVFEGTEAVTVRNDAHLTAETMQTALDNEFGRPAGFRAQSFF